MKRLLAYTVLTAMMCGHCASAATTTSPIIGSSTPLTPQQIVDEFTRLPIETQKLLAKILVSTDSQAERSATTQQLDAIFATLPADVQRNLYAKWDALSDEQRIALKHMDPDMIKSLIGPLLLTEATRGAAQAVAPIQSAFERSRSFAQQSREYIQGLIERNPTKQ